MGRVKKSLLSQYTNSWFFRSGEVMFDPLGFFRYKHTLCQYYARYKCHCAYICSLTSVYHYTLFVYHVHIILGSN